MTKSIKVESKLLTYETDYRRDNNPVRDARPLEPGRYFFNLTIDVKEEDIGKTFLEILNNATND